MYKTLRPSPARPPLMKFPTDIHQYSPTATSPTKAQAPAPVIPDLILPNLYLTDMFTARGVLLPTYPGHGRPVIRYVLSVIDCSINQPKPKPANRQNEFVQKLIIMDDTLDSDLLIYLNDACDWIRESLAKDDGGVMVHCHLGQSRSASMIIAHIMRENKLDYAAAFEKVKRKRSCIRPNPGFQKQLQLWCEMEYDIVDEEGNKKATYSEWKAEQTKHTKNFLADL